MKCEICNKKEATVHLTEIINDKMAKMHLCEDCAKDKGEEMETHFGLSDLLAGLADIGIQREEQKRAVVKCRSCGFSFMDFQKMGRLGCPDCYSTFEQQLSPLLRRIHGADRHVGKISVKETGDISAQKLDELHELQDKLQQAVIAEEFENAAVLRDKIKALHDKMRGS